MNTAHTLSEERAQFYRTLSDLIGVTEGIKLDRRQLDRELVQRALVRFGPDDKIYITEKGRQFLFQIECEKALHAISVEAESHIDESVAKWLASQRFVLEPCKTSSKWTLTPRGRAWLDTLGQSIGLGCVPSSKANP